MRRWLAASAVLLALAVPVRAQDDRTPDAALAHLLAEARQTVPGVRENFGATPVPLTLPTWRSSHSMCTPRAW